MNTLKKNRDIYGYEDRFNKAVARVKKDPGVTKSNKEKILEFAEFKRAQGRSLARVEKFVNTLLPIARGLTKDFETTTKEDLIKYVADLERSDLEASTKRDYKIILRVFWQWLKGCPRKKYPLEIDWLEVSEPKQKLPPSLLTENEVRRLIDMSGSTRTRALIACLFDSGGRIGEILPLRIGDVEMTEYCARLHVDGKTGERSIVLVSALPFLNDWLKEYLNRQFGRAAFSRWQQLERAYDLCCLGQDSPPSFKKSWF